MMFTRFTLTTESILTPEGNFGEFLKVGTDGSQKSWRISIALKTSDFQTSDSGYIMKQILQYFQSSDFDQMSGQSIIVDCAMCHSNASSQFRSAVYGPVRCGCSVVFWKNCRLIWWTLVGTGGDGKNTLQCFYFGKFYRCGNRTKSSETTAITGVSAISGSSNVLERN